MGIELRDDEPKDIITKEIVLNGEVIGAVKKRMPPDKLRYHVILKVGAGVHFQLAQGFGDTFESALQDSFVTGRKEAKLYVQRLGELQKEIAAE